MIRKGLVARWSFNEGSGSVAYDDVGGNDGTVYGATWVDGKYGKALNFDGASNYVEVPNSASLNPSVITLAAWIYWMGTSSGYQWIIAKGGGPEYGLQFDPNNAHLRFFVNGGLGITSNITVPTGQWVFCCGVFDGTTLTVYINGVSCGTANYSGSINPADTKVYIGGNTAWFSGIIDEVRIYNRALSATEIMLLYNGDIPRWLIQYYDGSCWREVITQRLDAVNEELNGHEEATFLIPNTAANRALVLSDWPVRVLFDYNEVYSGVLKAVGYSLTKLACTVYNDVFEPMQRRIYSGSWTNTAANTILGDILGTGFSQQTFGKSTAGGSIDGVYPGGIEGSRVWLGNISGGQLTKITWRCTPWGETTNVKVAVYDDSGGRPNNRLGISDQVQLTSADFAWVDFPFSSPVSLTANSYYWFIFETQNAYVAGSGIWTGANHCYASSPYGTFPDPFGTPTGEYTWQMDMYGTLNIGTPVDTCPTTVITAISWDNVLSFKAATDIAKQLELDYWGEAGEFNIGVRNRCVLALSFDEGAGDEAADSSGYGNNGQLYPALASFTFGRTASNETPARTADYKYASKFTANGSGYLTKITARCNRASTTGNMKCALYADSGGSPGALIAETQEVSVGTSIATVDFPFDPENQPTVVDSTDYWLAISTNENFVVASQTTGSTLYNADTYSDGFSDPFGSPSTSSGHELRISASGLTNPPTWVDGKYGKAVQFNGADNKLVIMDDASHASLGEDGGSYTANIWFKTSSSEQYMGLWDKTYYPTTPLYIYFVDGYIHAIIRKNYPTYDYELISLSTLNDGEYHMVTVVKDVTEFKLYVDCILQGSTTISDQDYSLPTTQMFMGMRAGYDLMFDGIIDETLLYLRAFSIEEIAWLYNQKPRGCHRGVDRSKRRSKIYCKGWDLSGNRETGEAGEGDDAAVYTKLEPADADALNNAAAALLTSLSKSSTGTSITVPVTTGVYWKPGDTIPLHIDELAINGLYRIQKITKISARVTVEVEKPQVILETLLEQIKATALEQITVRAGVAFNAQSAAPSSPKGGDLWLDTDDGSYHYYDGSDWQEFQPV